MGIIKKQSIGYSIVSYLGVLIGSISTLFIYPKNDQIYGLFRFLTDTANIFVPFATLGATYVAIRMFPVFMNKEKGHHGFLGILLLMITLGSLICTVFYFCFFDSIFDTSQMQDMALFNRYLIFIVPLFFLMGTFMVLKTYCNNLYQVIIPNILEQSIKITFPATFLLFLSNIISLDVLIWLILGHYVFVCFSVILFLMQKKEFTIAIDRQFLNPDIKKQLRNFALFGIAGSGGAMLVLRIDTFMVGKLTGNLSDTGSFNISSLIASNILIPLTAIYAVATPIITKAWNENNLLEINNVYKKSAEILLICALLLFGCVWLSVDDLFALMPNRASSSAAKAVVFFVGLKCVFDMATGINDAIISYSPNYKFALYLLPVTLAINIFGNIIFIPKYGYAGAAIATFLTSIVFNLIKLVYLYLKYQLNPYTLKTIYIVLIGFFCYFITYFFPNNWHPFINIVLKSSIFVGLFVSILLYFKISEEMDFYWKKLIDKIPFKLK
jgi:O-antigen/teichoic acid export membrane protein